MDTTTAFLMIIFFLLGHGSARLPTKAKDRRNGSPGRRPGDRDALTHMYDMLGQILDQTRQPGPNGHHTGGPEDVDP